VQPQCRFGTDVKFLVKWQENGERLTRIDTTNYELMIASTVGEEDGASYASLRMLCGARQVELIEALG
jgi:hypothetical protein